MKKGPVLVPVPTRGRLCCPSASHLQSTISQLFHAKYQDSPLTSLDTHGFSRLCRDLVPPVLRRWRLEPDTAYARLLLIPQD